MHFYYLDEAGCTGGNLSDGQQPIFVLGGLSVSDEKWIKTQESIQALLMKRLSGRMGSRFELHASQLLSPAGEGPFQGMDREARNELALELLGLLKKLHHSTHYIAIDKSSLRSTNAPGDVVRVPDPYPLAFDAMITRIEWHVSKKLGSTARALIVTDRKDQYEGDVADIIQRRRFEGAKSSRVRRLVEFTHPVDSKRNPLVQMADLISFCVKRMLEVDLGYKQSLPESAIEFFGEAFSIIEDRNPHKTLVVREGKASASIELLYRDAFVGPKRRGVRIT